jgi:DNA replication protein DnaC
MECGGTGIREFLRHLSWRTEHPDDISWCNCQVAETRKEEQGRRYREIQFRKINNIFYRPGIPKRFENCTLDSYPKEKGKTHGLRIAREYLENACVTIGQKVCNSIFFWGPVGTGKTGLAIPIMREWLNRGRIAIFQEYYEFMGNLQALYGNGDVSRYIQAAQEVDLLVLDDLGSESLSRGKETSDKTEKLFRILNYRHSNNLPTLITSNLDLDGVEQFFEKRIASRIVEMCVCVHINGRDLRKPL